MCRAVPARDSLKHRHPPPTPNVGANGGIHTFSIMLGLSRGSDFPERVLAPPAPAAATTRTRKIKREHVPAMNGVPVPPLADGSVKQLYEWSSLLLHIHWDG